MSPAPPLLEIRDLRIEFDAQHGRRRVVDDLSLRVGEGEVLGILGESGSGKTLTTLAVLGLVAGYPGVVGGAIDLMDGGEVVPLLAELPSVLRAGRGGGPVQKDDRRWQRLITRRMRGLWGRTVTAVFQNPRLSLDPLMTVGAQVGESVRLSEPALRRAGRAAVAERVVDWLERVRMNEPGRVCRSYPHELSGGMCQRAMIAIALARKPLLLVADEPCTGLDMTVRAEIIELFRDLLAEERRSMMYISHDIREVLYLADRVIVMRYGRIVETVSADDLRDGRGDRDPYTQLLLSAADLATEVS